MEHLRAASMNIIFKVQTTLNPLEVLTSNDKLAGEILVFTVTNLNIHVFIGIGTKLLP
jgi:hypothetical protein